MLSARLKLRIPNIFPHQIQGYSRSCPRDGVLLAPLNALACQSTLIPAYFNEISRLVSTTLFKNYKKEKSSHDGCGFLSSLQVDEIHFSAHVSAVLKKLIT